MRSRTAALRMLFPLVILALGTGACTVSSPVSGLKPIYPEARSKMFTKGGLTEIEFVEVDSLQPTFRWEPFPGTHEIGVLRPGRPFVTEEPERIGAVSYDLRIWRVKGGRPAEMVYERSDVKQTSHRLGEPLEPATRYFWSLRARFELDGRIRLSEWSLVQHPYPVDEAGDMPIWTLRAVTPRDVARRIGRIPAVNYYRFVTPAGPVVSQEESE